MPPPDYDLPKDGSRPPDFGNEAWRHMLGILCQARLELDWSLDQLAGQMKVPVPTLSGAESGDLIPNVVFVLMWTRALRLDMAKLYSADYRLNASKETSPD